MVFTVRQNYNEKNKNKISGMTRVKDQFYPLLKKTNGFLSYDVYFRRK